MPFRLRPNTFMVANVTRSVRLTPPVGQGPSAFITVWMPADAADVLVGLGLQVRVGVVVAAEADADRDDRRDVRGEQRRRGQRLAVDVVGGDRVQRRAELFGQRAHLRLAGGQLVQELLLDGAAVVLGHLVQLVQRLVAQRARLDQRDRSRDPVSSCLSCVGEIDGSVRPAKLTSSLELPRAPTEIGAACTVPKQVDRCFA